MLTITKQSDYGMIFLSNLVGKKDHVPLSVLVEQTKLPQRFLARIAASLVKNKIVSSREGKVGGYRLAVGLNKVSLFDFLKIFEKNVAVCHCDSDDYQCKYEDVCEHQNFMRKTLNKTFISELKKIKLSQLLGK